MTEKIAAQKSLLLNSKIPTHVERTPFHKRLCCKQFNGNINGGRRAENPFHLSEEDWNGEKKKKEGRKLPVAATVSVAGLLISSAKHEVFQVSLEEHSYFDRYHLSFGRSTF